MKDLSSVNKFFEIEYDENFSKNIFEVLREIIDFNAGHIHYNEDKPEYLYGNVKNGVVLSEELKIKKIPIGEISISADCFSEEDKKRFRVCAGVISSIIKDYEISQIMKMQVNALQDGYLKVKQAEEVKTKFISHISHELRTPLNSILSISGILYDELIGSLNEKQKDYINDIKVSGLNLLNMINEILDISKIEAGAMKLNLRKFWVSQVISEAENIIKPLLINKNIKFKKNIEDCEICADYQKIQQILLNLLSNAIKYTKNRIILTVKKSKKYVIISVEDNGIGIASENREKIFNKFEQLDFGMENSTGLGLAVVKEFVKLHNGDIKVSGNNGAVFTVKIPI